MPWRSAVQIARQERVPLPGRSSSGMSRSARSGRTPGASSCTKPAEDNGACAKERASNGSNEPASTSAVTPPTSASGTSCRDEVVQVREDHVGDDTEPRRDQRRHGDHAHDRGATRDRRRGQEDHARRREECSANAPAEQRQGEPRERDDHRRRRAMQPRADDQVAQVGEQVRHTEDERSEREGPARSADCNEERRGDGGHREGRHAQVARAEHGGGCDVARADTGRDDGGVSAVRRGGSQVRSESRKGAGVARTGRADRYGLQRSSPDVRPATPCAHHPFTRHQARVPRHPLNSFRPLRPLRPCGSLSTNTLTTPAGRSPPPARSAARTPARRTPPRSRSRG